MCKKNNNLIFLTGAEKGPCVNDNSSDVATAAFIKPALELIDFI